MLSIIIIESKKRAAQGGLKVGLSMPFPYLNSLLESRLSARLLGMSRIPLPSFAPS